MKEAGADPFIGRKLNPFFSNRFTVVDYFCTSVPWISNIYKNDLLKEADFFEKVLSRDAFDSELMRASIEREQYLLFIPVFSYYLKKS